MYEEKTGYVYIMASISKVLYIGVTSDLERWVWEHKNNFYRGFTARYNVHRLVYFEVWEEIAAAIDREKQLKR